MFFNTFADRFSIQRQMNIPGNIELFFSEIFALLIQLLYGIRGKMLETGTLREVQATIFTRNMAS